MHILKDAVYTRRHLLKFLGQLLRLLDSLPFHGSKPFVCILYQGLQFPEFRLRAARSLSSTEGRRAPIATAEVRASNKVS